MEYILKAAVLDQPDRSDPENKLLVLGLRVQEVSWVSRRTVIEETGPDSSTIRQIREDGKRDFCWGCKVKVLREGDGLPMERALAALVLCLLRSPLPEPVAVAIQEALAKPGKGAEWTPWFDLTLETRAPGTVSVT